VIHVPHGDCFEKIETVENIGLPGSIGTDKNINHIKWYELTDHVAKRLEPFDVQGYHFHEVALANRILLA
jgi:hypothetical protein